MTPNQGNTSGVKARERIGKRKSGGQTGLNIDDFFAKQKQRDKARMQFERKILLEATDHFFDRWELATRK